MASFCYVISDRIVCHESVTTLDFSTRSRLHKHELETKMDHSSFPKKNLHYGFIFHENVAVYYTIQQKGHFYCLI